MINLSDKKRDFLYFALLILLIKIAINQPKNSIEQPVLYPPAQQSHLMTALDNTHEQSIQEEIIDNTYQNIKEKLSKTTHQADQEILNHIDQAESHIAQLAPFIKPATKKNTQLKSITQRLAQLKKEYKHTSPAIALLGPIGTTGIILKETELEKNLLKIVNVLRTLLQTLIHDQSDAPAYTSIKQGIEHNTILLSSLLEERLTQS